MPDVKPSDHGPNETRQSESQVSSSGVSSSKPSRFDFIGVLKIAGSLIAAIAALLAAMNGADWLRSATPIAIPSPTLVATQVTSSTSTPSPVPQPTATVLLPTATAETQLPEGTLLIEDFSDPSSGWETQATEEYALEYVEGEYRVRVHTPDLAAWGRPPRAYEFTDLVIEVDVRQVSGPEDGDYGLVVRSKGDSDFYLFAISSHCGMYSVQMSQGENWTDLAEWTESAAVRREGEVNHLKVECLGGTMRFYANGVLLTEVTDTTYQVGNVGLLAETFEEGGLVVRFDNVRVQVLKGF